MADINDRALDVSITDDNQTKKVSVITDGLTERLAVDAKITNQASGFVEDGRAWSIVITETVLTSGEKAFFLLENPNGSGKKCTLLDVVYSTDSQQSIMRYYRNPTIISNGTPLTPENFLITAGSPTVLAYKNATVSSFGTILRSEFTNQKANPSINPLAIRIISPNEKFLISISASNNAKHYLTVTIGESDI